MKSIKHYEPAHTSTYMADKTDVRFILAIASSRKLNLEHFDIKSAHLRKKYDPKKQVFFCQLACFDGK